MNLKKKWNVQISIRASFYFFRKIYGGNKVTDRDRREELVSQT